MIQLKPHRAWLDELPVVLVVLLAISPIVFAINKGSTKYEADPLYPHFYEVKSSWFGLIQHRYRVRFSTNANDFGWRTMTDAEVKREEAAEARKGWPETNYSMGDRADLP